jgi:hypothetical protein
MLPTYKSTNAIAPMYSWAAAAVHCFSPVTPAAAGNGICRSVTAGNCTSVRPEFWPRHCIAARGCPALLLEHGCQLQSRLSLLLKHLCCTLPAVSVVLQQSKAIDNDRDMVRKTLRDIKAAGFNVIRIWAFNDGQGHGKLQTRPGRRLCSARLFCTCGVLHATKHAAVLLQGNRPWGSTACKTRCAANTPLNTLHSSKLTDVIW